MSPRQQFQARRGPSPQASLAKAVNSVCKKRQVAHTNTRQEQHHTTHDTTRTTSQTTMRRPTPLTSQRSKVVRRRRVPPPTPRWVAAPKSACEQDTVSDGEGVDLVGVNRVGVNRLSSRQQCRAHRAPSPHAFLAKGVNSTRVNRTRSRFDLVGVNRVGVNLAHGGRRADA